MKEGDSILVMILVLASITLIFGIAIYEIAKTQAVGVVVILVWILLALFKGFLNDL